MKQLADSDIVHVHGGGKIEGGLSIPHYGPSAAQIAQFLGSIFGPRTAHHSN